MDNDKICERLAIITVSSLVILLLIGYYVRYENFAKQIKHHPRHATLTHQQHKLPHHEAPHHTKPHHAKPHTMTHPVKSHHVQPHSAKPTHMPVEPSLPTPVHIMPEPAHKIAPATMIHHELPKPVHKTEVPVHKTEPKPVHKIEAPKHKTEPAKPSSSESVGSYVVNGEIYGYTADGKVVSNFGKKISYNEIDLNLESEKPIKNDLPVPANELLNQY